MENDDKLLDQNEAADFLNLAGSTLNGWRVQGVGPPYLRLTARCIRYRESDLRRWVEARRVVGAEARRIEQSASR